MSDVNDKGAAVSTYRLRVGETHSGYFYKNTVFLRE